MIVITFVIVFKTLPFYLCIITIVKKEYEKF